MGRCIIVLGIPRSGTSCLAGVLHKLGVNMGSGYLQQGNQSNQSGYFEDLRWQRLNKQITGERYSLLDHPNYQTLNGYKELATTCNKNPLWGMKDPRLCVTLKYIAPYLEDCRIVAIIRSIKASARSLAEHSRVNYGGAYRMSIGEAEAIQRAWSDHMIRTLDEFDGPIQLVEYIDLINNTKHEVKQVAGFAFKGIGFTPNIESAIRFVNAGLNHSGK